MTALEGFEAWPKIPRLNRNIIITEKIDGTNACLVVRELDATELLADHEVHFGNADGDWALFAQSRSRIITPQQDNAGFARWAHDNAGTLIRGLGVGRHFGEWWGQGIQRGYGLDGKRFSLFNTKRWAIFDAGWAGPHPMADLDEIGVGVVPVLSQFPFDSTHIDNVVRELGESGSRAAPGFMDPEGVVVFQPQTQAMFKVTCKNDEASKGELAAVGV